MLTSRTSLENVEVEADFYGLVELKREVRKMIVEAEEARVEEEGRADSGTGPGADEEAGGDQQEGGGCHQEPGGNHS